MNTVKAPTLTVQTPIPQKHLSRFRNKSGVFLIRRNDTVLCIGSATNLYKVIMRLFQKNGILNNINRNKLTFEIVETSLLFRNIETVLKRRYKPEYNKRIKAEGKLSSYEIKRNKRILDNYLDQTRFEAQGEHITDKNNS
jgi:excinuclease UvrABC nuclease subunit